MQKSQIIEDYLRQEAAKPASAHKMPTVRTLAEQFHVSTQTVMRALSSLEQQKVIARHQGSGITALRRPAIEELQFSESFTAPYIVTAIVDYPSESLWRFNFLIEPELQHNGFQPIPWRLSSHSDILRLCQWCKMKKNCAGLVIIGTYDRLSDETLATIGEMPFRVVLLVHMQTDYTKLPPNLLIATYNENSTVEKAVNHFVSYGHKKLGFVVCDPYIDQMKQQIQTFKQACINCGLKFTQNHIFSREICNWDNSINATRYIIEQDFQKIIKTDITGLFFPSSYGALAAIGVLQRRAIRIPEDISIISEGDYKFCENIVPALTLLATDDEQLIRIAIRFLNGERFDKQIILLDKKIIERESVAQR